MKTIAIDIDGVLAKTDTWEGPDIIGPPHDQAEIFLKSLLDRTWTICAWSCRADHIIDDWLRKHKLRQYFHYINQSPYPSDSRKSLFDVYIGDECVRFTGGSLLDITENLKVQRPFGDTLERDYFWGSRTPEVYYKGVGRMYIDLFEKHWKRCWEQKKDYNRIALLTNCSHAKPYSKSYIHMVIRGELFRYGMLGDIDYIHLSSAGVIPHENSIDFPFYAYDNDSKENTPEILEYYRKSLLQRLNYWYDNYGRKYKNIVVYLRPKSNTLKAVIDSNILSVNVVPELADPLQFAINPDIDDCFVNPSNLAKLIGAVKDAL